MALKKAATLADQLADELRGAILRGDYSNAEPLPSESQLAQTYGVSRVTVRAAIAALRGEGLITVEHGRGSFVRAQAPREYIRRSVADPDRNPGPRDPAPVLAYAPATAEIAALLRIEPGTETVVRECPSTSEPAPHILTSHLPASITTGNVLAEPHLSIGAIDTALTELGHQLTWTESVTARMPTPHERATFRIGDGTPLLRAARITTDTRDGTTLEARITLLPADGIELEYTLGAP